MFLIVYWHKLGGMSAVYKVLELKNKKKSIDILRFCDFSKLIIVKRMFIQIYIPFVTYYSQFIHFFLYFITQSFSKSYKVSLSSDKF